MLAFFLLSSIIFKRWFLKGWSVQLARLHAWLAQSVSLWEHLIALEEWHPTLSIKTASVIPHYQSCERSLHVSAVFKPFMSGFGATYKRNRPAWKMHDTEFKHWHNTRVQKYEMNLWDNIIAHRVKTCIKPLIIWVHTSFKMLTLQLNQPGD